jgi:hypothetical protein
MKNTRGCYPDSQDDLEYEYKEAQRQNKHNQLPSSNISKKMSSPSKKKTLDEVITLKNNLKSIQLNATKKKSKETLYSELRTIIEIQIQEMTQHWEDNQ